MATAQQKIESLKRRKVPPLGAGGIASGIVEEMGLTVTEFAARIGVSRVQVSRIFNGHCGLTPDMANRFGRFFGNGAAFWMRCQHTRDLWFLIHMDTDKYQDIEPAQKAA